MKTHFAIVAFLLWFATAVSAAQFQVDKSGDTHDVLPGDGICADAETGGCSLRAALEESNALSGPDTIRFDYGLDIIRLTLGSLVIEDDATVLEGGNGYPVVDGAGNPVIAPLLRILSNGNGLFGLTWQRCDVDGIVVLGSSNQIGGSSTESGNRFLFNGYRIDVGAGLALVGADAHDNNIINNWLGVGGNGTVPYPNQNGIRFEAGTHDNFVDGNVIDANERCGIILTGHADRNLIKSNLIGLDVTARGGSGNGLDGISIEDESAVNLIGDTTGLLGNIIGLNGRHGVTVTGADSNVIADNLIGVDISGRTAVGNLSCGVVIRDGSRYNQIGGDHLPAGNVISGNVAAGVVLRGAGTTDNRVSGNHIGVDIDGIRWVGNGYPSLLDGHGVMIDSGAADNVIGGSLSEERNVISGNWRAGIWLSGLGTTGNKLLGNLIGVNALGSSSMANGVGVVLIDGASLNSVGGSLPGEGNVISGNRDDIFPYGCGVLISGTATTQNVIDGNMIGLDQGGTRALRNGSSGIIIGDGANRNQIGGVAGNVISGNGVDSYTNGLARGVHLFGEGTSLNSIIGNTIGPSIDLASGVSNTGHGIGFYAGAAFNYVGGDNPDDGNVIAYNGGCGVFVSGPECRGNLIRKNHMYANDSLAISLRASAQDGISSPVLLFAENGLIAGAGADAGVTIDLYRAAADLDGRGEGMEWIASVLASQTGSFSIFVSGLTPSDSLVAMSVDGLGNSSEFSNLIEYSEVSGVFSDDELPSRFAISQNYPNPFNPSTRINLSLPRASHVRMTIFNLLGRQIGSALDRQFAAGNHELFWDASTPNQPLPSGIYFARFETDFGTETIQMVFIK